MTDPHATPPSSPTGQGRVVWIGVAAAKRAPIEPLAAADVSIGTGLDRDHHARAPSRRRGGSRRQVTLVQAEHLPVVASCLGLPEVHPDQLRRNLVVAGLNLLALLAEGHERRFRVGPVLLEATGRCDPCERMDETLGPGGFRAMVGHGGITARVLEGGRIRVGDAVHVDAGSPLVQRTTPEEPAT